MDPVNVIPVSKFNKKVDPAKIFIPGTSIVDALRGVRVEEELVDGSLARVSARSRRANLQLLNGNALSVNLNDSFSKIDHVPGLKTTLYAHQQTAVKAMLDLEFVRCVELMSSRIGGIVKINYNACVLSEPVGSGKTIDILSLILMSKVPRNLPDIMELDYQTGVSHKGYIRRRFRKFLLPTLIFVGKSVMKQWSKAIKEFTDMKAYEVNSVLELRPLLEAIVDGSINKYDIVLVKNGKFTVEIVLPEGIELEEKNKATHPYFYNLLSNLRHYCWARVIVDDFDTIGLPANAGIVAGIMSWYVSSTRKATAARKKNIGFMSASEYLKKVDYGCANIMQNHFLFKYLNVRNEIEYIKNTTNIPNPKYWIASFTNPNNVYISLLQGMGGDQVNQITEMLNGDAIGAAAEAAGIKTSSVANIFEKLLGDKFQKYRFSGDLLSFIEHCNDSSDGWRPMSENPDEKDRYGKKDLLEFREIEYKYPGIRPLLDSTEEEYTGINKETGKAIERVKDNIKAGQCPICRDDLADCDDTAIAKCCGTVFCGNCAIKGQNLQDRSRKLVGRCSKCRAEISIKDLIYMENFDLSNIAEENFEDEETVVPAKAEEVKKEVTKYTAIIDIIMGRSVPKSNRVDMYIPNMMKGAAYLPEATVRKVLIFANYEETLKLAVEELDKNKIHYWRLMGTPSEIEKTAQAFTHCKTTCAMVINSTKHCSGLNLQTATDLVFTHLILDPAIESQVAGRGHRLGRKNPLNIWYLTYDNEVDLIKSTHGMRLMSQEELDFEKGVEAGQQHSTIVDVTDNSIDQGVKKVKVGKYRYENHANPVVSTRADGDEDDDEEDDDDEETVTEDDEE